MIDPGLGPLVTEFVADEEALQRRYPLPFSPRRRARLDQLDAEWLSRLEGCPAPTPVAMVDLHLFRRLLRHRPLRRQFVAEREPVPGWMLEIALLDEARMDGERPPAPDLAARLAALLPEVAAPEAGAHHLATTTETLRRWLAHYRDYDPAYAWWLAQPGDALLAALEALTPEDPPPPRPPVGRAEIEAELSHEGIPYSPEELIAIGEREYAWCEAQMRGAAAELGFGDDWHAALEHVKERALPAGEQAAHVRALALEATDWVQDRVTIPDLARETWRLDMMPAERQKVAPFFLGGEAILVSYPTQGMSHAEKRMAMRGNNPHFSRATVQHELIPGHHLQHFMLERHRPYRHLFGTPFWIEGWTLYWELLLWDLGFPATPEDRIGMLFWRMHRCVRIVFSLGYHLGQLAPEACIAMLVDRVGHEPSTAEGEVRRSFGGQYPPLYQAAYMIGGLQVYALRRELVEGGRMSERQFHDRFLHENQMPIAVLRQVLREEAPTEAEWRFDPGR